MIPPHTSANEETPNGQLMHLALEVMSQTVESRQNDDQNRDPISDLKNIALPPVCAL